VCNGGGGKQCLQGPSTDCVGRRRDGISVWRSRAGGGNANPLFAGSTIPLVGGLPPMQLLREAFFIADLGPFGSRTAALDTAEPLQILVAIHHPATTGVFFFIRTPARIFS